MTKSACLAYSVGDLVSWCVSSVCPEVECCTSVWSDYLNAVCTSDGGSIVLGTFHSATEHAEGALSMCYRCEVWSGACEWANSPCKARGVAEVVYCYSTAYCDSKFDNASAGVDGELCSTDPGTVCTSDDGSDGILVFGMI